MFHWQEKAQSELAGIRLSMNKPMAELTTFKIGGPIDLLVEPDNTEELERVLNFCLAFNIPWLLIGSGSNLLVRDGGIRGVGIKLGGEFATWAINGVTVSAGAAVSLSKLAKEVAEQGLSGLEFACGIPGSVGGAVYMNAGAYQGEISQIVDKVQTVSAGKGAGWFDKNDLNLGYRFSRFQAETNSVITRAEFSLEREAADLTRAKVAELTCLRESKQPLEMPSAGSVFRRPEGYYVGPLIEAAGLKGYKIGGAQVSPKHAGFIVNIGGATARDVLALISHVQKVIKERNGVDLIPEIKVVGEE